MSAPMIDRTLAALLRAIGELAPFRIDATVSAPWASATFAGARHKVALSLDGEDADARAARLRATLGAMEFRLPGQLVADILVLPTVDAALAFEVLTIEDC